MHSITVNYKTPQRSTVTVNLGEAFIEEAIINPPKDISINKRAYEQVPTRKKVFMHVRSYVGDMGGSDMAFTIN
jgi:hypothetical protein